MGLSSAILYGRQEPVKLNVRRLAFFIIIKLFKQIKNY
jgi:hypothetical protein